MRLARHLAMAVDPGRMFRAYVGSEPEPWQSGVLLSRSARLALLCARQVGKSTTVAVLAAHTAEYRPGNTTLIVSPTQRQSNETLAKARAVLKSVTTVEGSVTEVRTESGSRIVALPGDDETIRGFSAVELLIFDEAAWVGENAFVSASPMVAPTGRIVALTTSGSRTGWFYERAWMEPESDWERVKVSAQVSARYTPEVLERRRREIGERQFRAEYLCEFVGLTEAAFDPDKVEVAFSPHVRTIFGEASCPA